MKLQKRTVRKERNYTVIDNSLITDNHISPEARLTLIYLLSRPDDWSAWRKDIMNVCNMGKDKYNRVMRELTESGYVMIHTGGLGGGGQLFVFEAPDSGCRETRLPPNPPTVKPDSIVSTELLLSTDITKNICSSGDERFDEWYEQYPRKQGKAQARKTWKRKNYDAIADKIIADTKERSRVEWPHLIATKDVSLIPYASTYVNQERWQDEIIAPSETQKKVSIPKDDNECVRFGAQHGIHAKIGESMYNYRQRLTAAL